MREGWVRVSLDEIATEMYRGSGIKRDQVISEGFPCVRYGEIYTSYNIAFNRCISHTIESEIASKKYFEKGDILFAITGESVEDIGKSIAYLGDEKCLAGGDIVVMKHNQNAKFISYALSTKDAIKQKGFGKTKLKVVHTNVPSLKAIEINILQSLSEQQRIVTYLDSSFSKIDELKENVAKELSEAKALFQAELKKCMEKKEGWEEKSIKEVGDVVGGTTPSTSNPAFWDGDLCWISPAELKGNHYLYDSVKKITNEAVKAKSLKLLPIGTVILSSRAPIGKVTINKVPTYCNQGFKCVICKEQLYNEFLYWWFWGNTDHLNSLGSGATFAEISKTVVENITIPVPPLATQRQIVTHLDTLSQKIQELEKNYNTILAECDALKQAILRETFE